MSDPLVSVIIIAYNDAEHLPTAVNSVLRQTLDTVEVIIVDDASTDGTAAVADDFSEAFTQVTVLRHAVNSGGCSAPRNTGLAHARGRYVMFLDSDDYYHEDACAELVHQAIEHDADIVGGACVRRDLSRGTTKQWRAFLYTELRVIDGLAEYPQLIWDAICTNKLYRRQFLLDNHISFAVGVLYEDILFTAQAYSMASRIVLTPACVYYWNNARDVQDPSISFDKTNVANLRDRIAILRRVDGHFARHADERTHQLFRRKSIAYDVRLYLDRLLEVQDPEAQQAFVDVVADYLDVIGDQPLLRLKPLQRERALLVRNRDVDGVIALTRRLQHAGEDASVSGERMKQSDPSATPEPGAAHGRRSIGLVGGSTRHSELMTRVRECDVRSKVLLLYGELEGPGEAIEDLDIGSMALRVRAIRMRKRGRPYAADFNVTAARTVGGVVHWQVAVPLSAVTNSFRRAGDRRVRLRVRQGNVVHSLPLGWTENPAAGTPARVRSRPVVGDQWHVALLTTSKGNLQLRLRRRPGVQEATRRLFARLARRLARRRVVQQAVRVWRTPRSAVRLLQSTRTKSRIAGTVFVRLPPRRRWVVFESHLGRAYSDSPKYIEKALMESTDEHRTFWVHRGDTAGYPEDAELLARGSWRYYYTLARAGYWIDNHGIARQVPKASHTVYVQTLHGTPLKLMGMDQARRSAQSPARVGAMRDAWKRWDYLVVPSEYAETTLGRAFEFEGEVLRFGYPRNDALCQERSADEVTAIKESLGLPCDRKVVLYAPTFRDKQARKRKLHRPVFDFDYLEGALSDEYVFLVRAHYFTRFRLPRGYSSFLYDVTSYPDITQLLSVTDLLITDYSSVMFDFANTGRPMVFYAYDYAYYRDQLRGLYFDLLEVAPGPVVRTTRELTSCIRDIDSVSASYHHRYITFRERFCGYETGKAAQSVVERVFGQGEPVRRSAKQA